MKARTKGTTIFLIALILALMFGGCSAEGDNGGSGTNGEGRPNDRLPLEGDLTGIIEQIYEKTGFDLNVESWSVDLTDSESVKFNMGLDDASQIKEAVMSEALISSQAYSLILARVSDEGEAEGVAKAMLNGVDPRKWICVEADDLRVVAYRDAVLLVMIDSNLGTSTSKELVDAFGEICGGDFDTALIK